MSALRDPLPAGAVEAGVRALRAGGIIAIPTDTVYGLAADPFHAGATDRLFALKRRPRKVELPVLVGDDEQALSLTVAVPEPARRLMQRFWPGPLTLVLPRRPDLNADLGEDDATIGVRCPAHPVPLALCGQLGPIATSSANRHGQPPLTTAGEVYAEFGEGVDLVIDGGQCAGTPSTVVDCTGEEPRLLREGRLAWEDLLAQAKG